VAINAKLLEQKIMRVITDKNKLPQLFAIEGLRDRTSNFHIVKNN